MAARSGDAFEPKEHLGAVLDMWSRQFLAADERVWGDARNPDEPGANCILDSEILLIFLSVIKLPDFHFDSRSYADEDVSDDGTVYRVLKEAYPKLTYTEWNERVREVLQVYFERNTAEDGTPTFSSDSYLKARLGVDAQKSGIETVDAYSFSLTVSLYVKELADRLMQTDREKKAWARIGELASTRISASMRGLLASFAVLEMPTDIWEKNSGLRWPENEAAGNPRADKRLTGVRKRLDAMGYEPQRHGQFSNAKKDAFEIGWSWGPLHVDAIKTQDASLTKWAKSLSLTAERAPYLYFTINALDGIADLKDTGAESGGVLNSEQLAMAATLRAMADMTSDYWLAVTTVDDDEGPGGWAIETIPWKTSDAAASPYWNLFLARQILLFGNLTEKDIARFATLAERLGEAARITTPPYPPETDSAVESIHFPGLAVNLIAEEFAGEEGVCVFEWSSFDFAPQLLKLVAQLVAKTSDPSTQQRLYRLSNRIWRHLEARVIRGLGGACWDNMLDVFEEMETPAFDEDNVRAKLALPFRKEDGVNSWYMTERVVEALISMASAEDSKPKPSAELQRLATLLSQEVQWHITSKTKNAQRKMELREQLRRTEDLIEDSPGEALARLFKIIREVD